MKLSFNNTVMPLRCLWAKSNNRTSRQFECDMAWFCFCFGFVRSHARRGCCSIVCLPFQSVQIKQIDCKIRTNTVQKLKFSIEDFFSKYDQIRSFLRIWSHLLKKSLMENFLCSAKM